MIRWKLQTLDGLEGYTFAINPNAQDSPLPARTITWQPTFYGYTGIRAGRQPHPWSFSGVLRDKQMYDDLLAWCSRPERLKLTDDRGDSWEVRLTAFIPTQVAAPRLRHAPWRHTYTIRALIYRELP